MVTLTIQLPNDQHERLQKLASAKGISIDQLVEEISTLALAEFDAYQRFQTMADRGDRQIGLNLLDKLDNSNT